MYEKGVTEDNSSQGEDKFEKAYIVADLLEVTWGNKTFALSACP
jgi:hypothetical protein